MKIGTPKTIWVIFIFLLLSSCEKDVPEKINIEPPEFSIANVGHSVFSFQDFPGVLRESNISIYGSNNNGNYGNFIIEGHFTPDGKSLKYVQNFSVNRKRVSITNNESNNFYRRAERINQNNIPTFFGKLIEIEVTGGPLGDIQESIYSPQLIDFTLSGDSRAISKGSALNISWTPDTTFDSIHLYLVPRPFKVSNPNHLPEINLIIENDGSYSLSKEYWKNYEIEGRFNGPDAFELFLGLATQKLIIHEPEKETLITIYNYDSHRLTVVE